MANERNSGGGGKTAATVGILALLLMLGGGGYFGLGPGAGLGTGSSDGNSEAQKQEESVEEAEQAAETAEAEEETQEEQVPDVIVVSIKQDKVTINGHEVSNEEELRSYVEEYNSDNRTFTLEEDQSILDTYNWVKSVFDDLDIQLKNAK